jgi:hypothetical protein
MDTTRRDFLRTLVGGVAGAVRTWPFRVYSFPAEIERRPIEIIVCPDHLRGLISGLPPFEATEWDIYMVTGQAAAQAQILARAPSRLGRLSRRLRIPKGAIVEIAAQPPAGGPRQAILRGWEMDLGHS